jgi:LuxR family transcriptional regulator, maltose regulon positive regulatory protein
MLRQTKFDHPSIPQDLVARPRLTDTLDQGLSRPLTLICAPAGYGKTILASSFLETCSLPSVWLSLDENDNDLRLFLDYLLAAIDSAFPDSLRGTKVILAGANLPPVSVIADSLINELAGLGRPFVLVLDDLHEIHDPDIYRLLDALLQHPLQGFHLMFLTRREPALGLGKLRARDQVTEIRSHDLRFSMEETAVFMDRAIDGVLRDDALQALTERTEGWAAGLRLAALTLRYGGDVDHQVARSHAENRYVTDYLVSEVLAHVPPEIRDFLIKTSVLSRLCGPLCDAVTQSEALPPHGQPHLEWLENANLFTMSLDEQRHWFRYHHLFHVLLQKELARQLTAEEVRVLHRRASAWYASQGDVEEGLRHALAGQDTLGAMQLVAEHRHHLLNTEQRPRLERWLRLFSGTDGLQHPDLVLARAWLALPGRANSRTVLELVEQAQALVYQMTGQAEHASQLQGEIDTLRSIEKGFAASDPQGVITLATRALETMPRQWYTVRSSAWLHLAAAYQMSGQLDRSYTVLAEGQQEDTAQIDSPRMRIEGSSAFIHWIAADLPGLLQTAQRMVAFSQAANLHESLSWGHYFLAAATYQLDDLAAAEVHARVVQAQRYASDPIAVAQSAFVLAAIHQARGLPEKARLVLDRVNDFLVETRSEALLPLVRAFGAELAARQGDIDTAGRWAATVGPLVPFGVMAFFYAPQLTLPKVLLAMNTPASRQQAAAALARLHAFVTGTHNTRFTIEVLAMQALLHHAEGNEPAALQALEQAVALAQPGGFVRVFVDLGPAMAGLLEQLAGRGIAPGYVEQILHAFSSFHSARSSLPISSSSSHSLIPSTRPAPQANLIEPLTWRELEVLALLAQRLSAKEIAQCLVISEATAKKHCANIFQKLAVNNRRQAVTAAIDLGLLPAQS